MRTTRFKNIDVDIRRIITDPAGNLWLMTQYSGLWYLKYTGSGLSDYRLYRFGLSQGLPRLDWDWVQCLEDKILVCTQTGLYEAKLPGGWDFDPAALRFMPGKTFPRNIYHQVSDTAVFRFTVAPPWYRTALAYVLYGTGLILLLAAAYIGHKVKVKQAILQERKKYEKCFLDPDLADTYTKQLLRFMETQKPYLDPNLSLASLAKAVGIQHHYISQVLNIKLEKNFWDFIKEYRIAEARKILADPAQDHLSILEAAINVGFNSSSTFNQAFKKITGMTPSAYKASRRVEKVA